MVSLLATQYVVITDFFSPRSLAASGRAMTAGFAFIAPNYQLLPPATGHEILEDIKDLFRFIESGINDSMTAYGRDDHIDSERIVAIGTSAGGLCAYLAGIHAKPKPRAILSMYGMGGNYFVGSFHLMVGCPRESLCARISDAALFHDQIDAFLPGTRTTGSGNVL